MNGKEPKERILEAAAMLFAQRGYGGCGVREIATAADVNISMISYYFNGKVGILQEIIKIYFEALHAIIGDIVAEKLETVPAIKKIIHEHVNLIKSRLSLCKVAVMELPLDLPEIREYKNQCFLEIHAMIQGTFHQDRPLARDPFYKCVIGPAMLGLIFSNFLMGHIVQPTSNIEFDDAFYDRYSETIATLFLAGVSGVADEERKKKNK